MSRFTLYLCFLVGLIAVVTAASLEYQNDGEVNPNGPSKTCVALVNARCSLIQNKIDRIACIAKWVKKLCSVTQTSSDLLV